ncbi:4-hydroxybenzoate polyprenyltransferase, mitochondrial-like [Chenopodium quinoa]|uniref:4-hydroxybenzoate polyprenyltransferase, mitochondrial-like n=1 Tax=Chenopodium quinoa TaxID=63459 RepID=UPI000B79AC1C|nr:4-hydroxybenzoate polyprenyltransferase, mitochondrial-like [Chenopodium quinoa]
MEKETQTNVEVPVVEVKEKLASVTEPIQDREDDLKVGVKSTALRFGDLTKEWVTGFGIISICSLALSGYNAHLGWPYFACLAAASRQMTWQIYTVDLSNCADCNRKYVLIPYN